MSYCNVWAEVVFLWFPKKGDVYTNFTMPIFCASPNSIMSLSFRGWSIPVSEIRELVFDGMVTMMLLEVQINAQFPNVHA